MSRFRLGLQAFGQDMQEKVSVQNSLLLAIAAFTVAFVVAVITGAHT